MSACVDAAVALWTGAKTIPEIAAFAALISGELIACGAGEVAACVAAIAGISKEEALLVQLGGNLANIATTSIACVRSLVPNNFLPGFDPPLPIAIDYSAASICCKKQSLNTGWKATGRGGVSPILAVEYQ